MQIGKAKKEGKIHKDKDKCKEKDNLNGNAFSKMWKIWIKLQNAKDFIKNAKKILWRDYLTSINESLL